MAADLRRGLIELVERTKPSLLYGNDSIKTRGQRTLLRALSDGMSRVELARACARRGVRVSPQTIGSLASGKTKDPGTRLACALRDALGIPVDAWSPIETGRSAVAHDASANERTLSPKSGKVDL